MDRALLGRVRKQAWFHRYPRGLPLLIFLICCCVIALAVIGIERSERQTRSLELQRNATEIAAGLQRRASENVALLSAAGAMFSSEDQVSPEAFAEFVREVDADDVTHGSLGIGWARYINRGALRGFELSMTERLQRDYTVHPVPQLMTNIVVPIVYLQPQTRPNYDAIGFDMYSEEVRRAAMDKAIELGQPIASGKVHLVQDSANPEESGFLIYMPVYEDRRQRSKVKGFVYSPFNTSRFLASASQLFGNYPVDIAIYDTTKAPENLLTKEITEGKAAETIDMPIRIAHRQWIVSVADMRPARLSVLSVTTILFGLIVAILLMLIARFMTRRATEDRLVLEWLSDQAAIRDSLTRELNHRVKNTLANVLSIISLTRRRYTDVDKFAESLDGRIRALSATHDLLSQSDWTNAAIRSVVESELAPYMHDESHSVEITGEDYNLAPNDALSLGLALHELATNAAKYGALSTQAGQVSVAWRKLSDDRLEVEWKESGGPTVKEPPKRGFGRDLLEKIVAHELQSEVAINFNPEGVECRLQVPLRASGPFTLRGREILRQPAAVG